MKLIRKIASIIAWTLLIIVAVPVLIVVGIPALIFFQLKAAIRFRFFQNREAGSVFLICTARRNWYDFLLNNVIPVLPDNVQIIWQKSAYRDGRPELFKHLYRSHIVGVLRPYLVAVSPAKLSCKSLNTALQEHKIHPKKSEDTLTFLPKTGPL